MAKIVLIGAGSHVFSRNIISDILSYPELRDGLISLMDIDQERLDFMAALTNKLLAQNGLKTRIETTTDRRKALDGADYVLTTVDAQGIEEHRAHYKLLQAHGIEQYGQGSTTGPGGVFAGVRRIPLLLDICHDMEELCPQAWLLNYTNPVSIGSVAITDYTRIKGIGLCHSTQGTAAQLARYLGVPYEELSYWVAGINHMAWFLELKWQGKDAYPLLKEKFKDPEVYSGAEARKHLFAGCPDTVRVEVFRLFGYFVTESSIHMSEFVPYFRRTPELLKKYHLMKDVDEYQARMDRQSQDDDELKHKFNSDYKFEVRRSLEYGATIIHSIETGTPSRINGNVKNMGLITNLPEGDCVEVPCLVDKKGITPCYVGALPPQLAALNRTNLNVQELALKGIMEKDKNLILQATLLDTLTSSILTIDEMKKLTDALFRAEAKYVKGYR